jgi:hypothetical protein
MLVYLINSYRKSSCHNSHDWRECWFNRKFNFFRKVSRWILLDGGSSRTWNMEHALGCNVNLINFFIKIHSQCEVTSSCEFSMIPMMVLHKFIVTGTILANVILSYILHIWEYLLLDIYHLKHGKYPAALLDFLV